MKNRPLFFALFAVLGSAMAHAQVASYSVAFYQDWEQTGSGVPVAIPTSAVSFRIDSGSDDAVTDATLFTPNNSYPLYYGGKRLMINGFNYATVPDALAANPSGTYTFHAASGVYAPDSGSISVPANSFPYQMPYLTTGFNALSTTAAGTGVGVTWTNFSHPGTVPSKLTYLNVLDYTEPGLVYSQSGAPASYTSDTVPGSARKSGHYYLYELGFNTYRSTAGGFGGAQAYIGYYDRCFGYYKVPAEPGTISGHIELGGRPFAVGNLITAEVFDGDGALLETHTISLGYYGWYAFDLDAIPAGPVKIRFKGDLWLAKSFLNVDASVGQDHLDMTLDSGDANNDNAVDSSDYFILSDAYDTLSSDVAYDPRADFDGSGAIDATDYFLLSDSYDKLGDE